MFDDQQIGAQFGNFSSLVQRFYFTPPPQVVNPQLPYEFANIFMPPPPPLLPPQMPNTSSKSPIYDSLSQPSTSALVNQEGLVSKKIEWLNLCFRRCFR